MIHEMFISSQCHKSQCKNEHVLLNALAENNCHVYPWSRGLGHRVYYVHNMIKKRNFSDLETETITKQDHLNNVVLCGNLKSGIKGVHIKSVWKEISVVNSVGVDNQN